MFRQLRHIEALNWTQLIKFVVVVTEGGLQVRACCVIGHDIIWWLVTIYWEEHAASDFNAEYLHVGNDFNRQLDEKMVKSGRLQCEFVLQ
jgi:hypothetical protein